MPVYLFCTEELDLFKQSIERLKTKILELNQEVGEAAKQSTENMGHDDACQEYARLDRVTAETRLRNLQEVLRSAVVVTSDHRISDLVSVGSIVELSNGRKLRIGSYISNSEHPIKTFSYGSPVGEEFFKKRVGEKVNLDGEVLSIVAVE